MQKWKLVRVIRSEGEDRVAGVLCARLYELEQEQGFPQYKCELKTLSELITREATISAMADHGVVVAKAVLEEIEALRTISAQLQREAVVRYEQEALRRQESRKQKHDNYLQNKERKREENRARTQAAKDGNKKLLSF